MSHQVETSNDAEAQALKAKAVRLNEDIELALTKHVTHTIDSIWQAMQAFGMSSEVLNYAKSAMIPHGQAWLGQSIDSRVWHLADTRVFPFLEQVRINNLLKFEKNMEKKLDMIKSKLEEKLAWFQELIRLQIGMFKTVTGKYHLETAHFENHLWRMEAMRRAQLTKILKEQVQKKQPIVEKQGDKLMQRLHHYLAIYEDKLIHNTLDQAVTLFEELEAKLNRELLALNH